MARAVLKSCAMRWLLVLLVAGCGASSHSHNSSGLTILISPASTTVVPGGMVRFTCVVTGSADPGCVFSVAEGASGGSVTPGGVYSAPAGDGTYHVIAASRADATTTATATITVHPPVAPMPGVWRDITPPSIDPSAMPCTDIQFDPSHPSTLFAYCGAGGGIWRSGDAGATWSAIGNLPMPNAFGRILIDPKDSSHLYACGSVINNPAQGFWVSHDGGVTWAIPPAFIAGASTTWNYDVYNMVVDPTDFNHVVMTFHYYWPGYNNAGLLESLDGGASFIAHPPQAFMDHAQGIAMLYNPALGLGDAKTWLLGGGYGPGLFRTTDGGANWTKVSDLSQDHGGFDAHYSRQGYLYIGATNGVYRSTDNGVTWEQETMGLPGGYFYSVIGDGNYLYTSNAFVGVDYNNPMFVSKEGGADEGRQWSAYSSQTLPSGPWKMTFDPVDRVLYNATWGRVWALTVDR
jgi:photosystem II stability/assembly factor-like uncharacterized protein